MKKINKRFIILVVFLFFLVIGYLFPYTNDDWAWASYIGENRLINFFRNYNGRYLGNLLVLVLTRYRIIRAIIISLFLTLITCFISKIVDKKNITVFLLISLLMVLTPQPLFRQAIAWTSGFANYVPPILATIIWIYLIKDLFENRSIKMSKWWLIPTFLFGVGSCLFMEHVTIYLICLSIFSIVYCLIKKIKLNCNQFSFLIGNVLGAILMFQNEAYHHVFKGDDFYRKIPKHEFILQSIKRYFTTVYDNLVMNNTIILIIICISLVFIFYKLIYKNKKIKNIRICKISLSIIIFYSMYSLISEFFPNWEIFGLIYKVMEGILTGIYFIALLVFILFIPNNVLKKKLYFFIGSIILMTLPLMIVSPVTPRCFYPMYILWIIVCLLLVLECFRYIKCEEFYKTLNFIICSMITIGMFYTGCIIYSAYHVTNRMISYIEIQKKNNITELIIPKTVYENYMKHPYPHTEQNYKRFKIYYGIPQNVDIKIVDYNIWHNLVEK